MTAPEPTTPDSLSRRKFITAGTLSLGSLCLGTVSCSNGADSAPNQNAPTPPADPSTPFTLPELSYPHDALAPNIDATTMEIHHGKHHAGYVRKLNAALEAGGIQPSGDLPKLLRNLNGLPAAQVTAVRNNGGGHYNHTLFWEIMSPNGGGEPAGKLGQQITGQFGSYAKFRETFTQAASSQFGSGWAWLCLTAQGTLHVCNTPNQDNPLMTGFVNPVGTPLLGLDVWEHAYYLNYQNRRGDYINNWWNVVNWSAVQDKFDQAS